VSPDISPEAVEAWARNAEDTDYFQTAEVLRALSQALTEARQERAAALQHLGTALAWTGAVEAPDSTVADLRADRLFYAQHVPEAK
jgi:hypothetical protein